MNNTSPAVVRNYDVAPITGFREWLDHLAAHDRLAVINPGMSLKHELAAIAKRYDGRAATFFPSPGGHAIPVVSGLISDRDWIADAVGVPRHALLDRYQEAAEHPLPWREVSTAPVQDIVHRDVDLTRLLPIPTHNELDSGPYVAGGLLVTRSPRSGVQNVSINRCQVSGPARLGVSVSSRDTGAFCALAEAAGQPLEVAIVIGADPLTLLASQAIVAQDQDELEIAGALRGEPLEVVRCLTKNLHVPAHAEIVIEGRFLPNVREPEGPFGEFTQYYGERAARWVIEVDAVTHRRRPIFHTILGGGLEHLLLGGVAREASFLSIIRRSFPTVTAVHLSKGGSCRYHLYIQMRKTHEGIAKNVIFSAFSTHHDVKQVIVVDEDIDIYDPQEVEWAVATRFQADRGLVYADNCRASRLDPTSRGGVGAKLGFDATKPLDAPELRFVRIRVPGEADVDPAAVRSPVAAKEWRDTIAS